MKKIFLFVTALVLFSVVSCSKKQNVQPDSDADIKIAVLGPADCEIVSALGSEKQIVAVGEYCDYPESLKNVPCVVSNFAVNTEQLLAIKPDLIIADAMSQNQETVSMLENLGFKVILTSASTFDEVYTVIQEIGKNIGKSSEAEKLVLDMKNKILDIQKEISVPDNKSIYFEVSPLEYGLWSAGNSTFMNEIAEILNVKNIFSDITGWSSVSQEQVISLNPDYIVTITMYTSTGESPESEIKNRKGWENISAVKNNAVFVTDSNSISRPGPRLVLALEDLYQAIYGKK